MQLQEDSLFLSLAELADINRGNKRHFERVAGTLFALASQKAIENSVGFMHMVAKTKLIHYYSETYGFTQIGNSQRMISTDVNSKNSVTLFL